jgi:uncharacterized protein (UPF0210 family)
MRRPAGKRLILKPAFFVRYVGVDEFLVAFGEVNDALNETDYPADTASADADDDLNDAFLGVAEDELMDSEAAHQDAENATQDFLFGPRYFFAHRFLRLN